MGVNYFVKYGRIYNLLINDIYQVFEIYIWIKYVYVEYVCVQYDKLYNIEK